MWLRCEPELISIAKGSLSLPKQAADAYIVEETQKAQTGDTPPSPVRFVLPCTTLKGRKKSKV